MVAFYGGKHKVNKSLKAWVAFVKKVQKEEKLSYKDAIHRAKVRKDKGEKWMMGGATEVFEEEAVIGNDITSTASMGGRRRHKSRRHKSMRGGEEAVIDDMEVADMNGNVAAMKEEKVEQMGGRRRRRTMRRSRGRGRGRTMRRGRGRALHGGLVIV